MKTLEAISRSTKMPKIESEKIDCLHRPCSRPVYPRQSNPRRSKPEHCTRAYYGLDDFYAAEASFEISACNRVEVIQDRGTCFKGSVDRSLLPRAIFLIFTRNRP